MKTKKVKGKKGERIGAVPTRGAPKQKQAKGGRAKKGKRGCLFKVILGASLQKMER